MQKFHRSALLVLCAALVAWLITGCSPQARKEKLLQSADAHYQAGDLDKAEIEYLNVLKVESLNPRAIGRLGLIYTAQGRSRAIAFVMKGNELAPQDLELRIKLGQLYQAMGRSADARMEANFVLDKNPQDPDAPLLLASTLANPAEAAALQEKLESLPAPAPSKAPVLVALATLQLRTGHPAEAEALLEQAKQEDPKYAPTYSTLGTLYGVRRNFPLADAALKQAATLSPPRSPTAVQYAQFRLRSGDPEGGKKFLQDLVEKTPDYVPAWVLLAEIAATEGNFSEASTLVNKALARDPQNLQASVIQGRIYNAGNESDRAIALFEKLAEMYPRFPVLHQELGRAYVAKGELNKALVSLNQAVALAPDSPDAVLLLAQLYGRRGDYNGAVALLRTLVEQHPENTRARLLLADSYRAQNNLDGALALYQQIEQQSPQNTQTPLLRGLILSQQGKLPEARAAFERAFELTSTSPTALEQLVNLDIKEQKFSESLARLRAEIPKKPKLEGFCHLLMAKVYLAQSDIAQAEPELKKTIELLPESPTAYFLLAGIYSRSNQQAKALEQLTEILKRDPKQITALMLMSVIYDQQGNVEKARDGYERLLAVNPRSGVALNNLAYLYSEKLNDLDKAQDLAQKARQQTPNDPHGADTLGWIMHRKRQYTWALNLLEDAADKLPAEGEVQYHAGMTSYMMGDEGTARVRFQSALQLEPSAAWANSVRRALEILALDPTAITSESKPIIDRALAENPDDPVALLRLATLHEAQDQNDQAIAALDIALKSNPQNSNVLFKLARAHAQAKHPAKALEYAKAARRLAPDDPAIAQSLGRLAFENGDAPWALSLLQEAARKNVDSPELSLDLGKAYFHVGKIPEATAAVRDALQKQSGKSSPFARQEEAQIFLRLAMLSESPAAAAKDVAFADEILKTDSTSLPALFVSALGHEQNQEAAASRLSYDKILSVYPDFVAAKKEIARLGADLTGFDSKVYEAASQARQAYPTNLVVAKTLGIQNFLKGDAARAVTLLRDYVVAQAQDPIALFYLGSAQQKLKSPDAASTLQRSVEAGLTGNLLIEAKRLLAESQKPKSA